MLFLLADALDTLCPVACIGSAIGYELDTVIDALDELKLLPDVDSSLVKQRFGTESDFSTEWE